MNNAPRQLMALPVSLLLFAACDQLPTQSTDAPTFNVAAADAAVRHVSDSLYDLTDSAVQITCDDETTSELVRLEGKLFERSVLLQDAAGNYHFTLHTMPVGLRGVGLTSGEEYRVSEREQITSNHSLMSTSGNYRQEVQFFGKDSKARFRMLVIGHYTVDENDEFIVSREAARFECRS